MRMHHDGMVSPDQWEEIMGLDWDRKLSEDDTSYHGALEAAIYIAHKTGFTGTEPLVVRLMLIVCSHILFHSTLCYLLEPL